MIINEFSIDPQTYQTTYPYPHIYIDNILDTTFAKNLQSELLNTPLEQFDRYDNPFEQKYTLRNKNKYTPLLQELFNELESPDFVDKLSNIIGYKLLLDNEKNFNGVHIYKPGDKLDIHVDAGIHPFTKFKKQVTVGIYLSSNWKDTYGCDLEIWKGSNASEEQPKLIECVSKISPLFNRMIIFTNTDDSWHGNPERACGPDDARRIFITISYLSNNISFNNKRQKAYFIARPNDINDIDKDKLRDLRCDPEKFKDIYRYNTNHSITII